MNNKTRDYLIESSETVKVGNLWYEITKDKQKYLVGVIYGHPKGNLTEFNEKLDNTLSKISSDRNINDCIITGDLNIDLIQFDTDTQTENYLNMMLRNAFMPTIILPTRIEKKLAHYWIISFIIPKHLEVIYFQVICSLTLVIIWQTFSY